MSSFTNTPPYYTIILFPLLLQSPLAVTVTVTVIVSPQDTAAVVVDGDASWFNNPQFRIYTKYVTVILVIATHTSINEFTHRWTERDSNRDMSSNYHLFISFFSLYCSYPRRWLTSIPIFLYFHFFFPHLLFLFFFFFLFFLFCCYIVYAVYGRYNQATVIYVSLLPVGTADTDGFHNVAFDVCSSKYFNALYCCVCLCVQIHNTHFQFYILDLISSNLTSWIFLVRIFKRIR